MCVALLRLNVRAWLFLGQGDRLLLNNQWMLNFFADSRTCPRKYKCFVPCPGWSFISITCFLICFWCWGSEENCLYWVFNAALAWWSCIFIWSFGVDGQVLAAVGRGLLATSKTGIDEGCRTCLGAFSQSLWGWWRYPWAERGADKKGKALDTVTLLTSSDHCYRYGGRWT